MSATYIFGHQNPDTDSICAALAYADFKQASGILNTKACCLGEVNPETTFALSYFNCKPPILLKTVTPQISDLKLNTYNFPNTSTSILKTLECISETPGHSIPIVDESDNLYGIVALNDILNAFIQPFQKGILKYNHTTYANIINILSAVVIGAKPNNIITGNLYANTELKKDHFLQSGDIVVSAYNDNSISKAYSSHASTIIIAEIPIGFKPTVPENFKGTILITAYPPFEVFRRITQSIPVKNYVNRENLEYFMTYETIADVKKNMLSSKYWQFPVINEKGKVLSSISKSDLLDYRKKQVILVDHNERNQSISGIDHAAITEVIDHHRIAEITTSMPLFMRIEPVGCTCTIIAKMYLEKSIPIPRPIAGIMLSAIISDTLLFNSPTCTNSDREMALFLADLASVDLYQYGRDLLNAGSNIAKMTPTEILSADSKSFVMGKYKICVSQINTGDFKGLYNKMNPLLETMSSICEKDHIDLFILMITDIVLGGSELMIAGHAKHLAQNAFGFTRKETNKYFEGFFSRKKQVIPPLMHIAVN